jgi:hypothetical protein
MAGMDPMDGMGEGWLGIWAGGFVGLVVGEVLAAEAFGPWLDLMPKETPRTGKTQSGAV